MDTMESVMKSTGGGEPSQGVSGAHQMSLFNQIVYMVLMLEVGVYLMTLIPMNFIPVSLRKKAISGARAFLNNRQVSFVFHLIMLICVLLLSDTIRRLIHLERVSAKHDANPVVDTSGCASLKVFSDKFYAQRNLYLSGFSVFMILVLHQRLTDVYLTLDLTEKNDFLNKEVKKMKIQAARLNNDPMGALTSSATISNSTNKQEFGSSAAEDEIDAAFAGLSGAPVGISDKAPDFVGLKERKKKTQERD